MRGLLLPSWLLYSDSAVSSDGQVSGDQHERTCAALELATEIGRETVMAGTYVAV